MNTNPDRDAVSAALWQAAEHHTIAEWICCDPINPSHDLCVAGGKALEMLRALLVDDPEAARPAPLLDAVLAVLPDRAAVLRDAADDLATAFGDPTAKHIGALGASHLRRRAREIKAGQTDEDRPETPLEKRLRYSERRNDELRAECKRRGKTVLEQSEKIRALERQIDEVRGQLGAEILRAGQAEAELRRVAAEAPTTKPEAEAWDVPDARPGTTDYTLTRRAAGVGQDGAQTRPAGRCPEAGGNPPLCFCGGGCLRTATRQDGAQR